ncbi:hypothetical protein TNCV_3941121 [Trichonephila clavipes]|uniref:Uncharacterized protein n=1 Tax=Trichonephila clavipes TaxID=2585209 RepID=A0A8X7B8T3_TRICX|nr:hypothetical protein TNCV_3941121 [Trichonephila clavipes]
MRPIVNNFHSSSDCDVKSVAVIAEWSRCRIVAGFVTSSSQVPLKTRRVRKRCTSRAQASSRWCDVPAQVSSTSLDHGSKLRGPSPKALV